MTYNIISSNSIDGNCILFEDNLLLDIGVSFKKLTNEIDVSKIKYLLLTHEHSDHFNITAIRKLFVKNENLQIICCEWMEDMMPFQERVHVVEIGKVYEFGDYKISPIKAYHDVPNCGYRIMLNDHKHFHITDTFCLDGISAKDYDSATIEANHEINKVNELIEEAKNNQEFTHLKGTKNSHLEVRKTLDFVKKNNIKKFTPCHIGGSSEKEVMELIEMRGY